MMISRVSVLIICLALSGPGAGYAGTSGKIAGNVKQTSSDQPLVGVNIVLEGTKLGAITDPNGDYYILNVPPGTYRLTASLIGFTKTTKTGVTVKIDQTTAVSFSLADEAVVTEGVTVTAEKPKVEIDLTASKESMTSDQINKSWGKDLEEVIADIPAANINGGIRGSFGNDLSYRVDGIDLRDVGTNTNFTSVNLSTIQAVEVLTGGWNAEFGQANGSIVNIVTRHSTDRLRGIATYRTRPAGKYHWGRDFYGEDDFFRTTMTTPQFWDPNSTWQTQWMPAPLNGYDGGVEPFKSMTPQERADWWKNFVNDRSVNPQIDYADRSQWESELTLYGPITSNLGFMLSGRYLEGVGIYPSARKYNPDMTLQGSLDWAATGQTRFSATGLFTKFRNAGSPRTSYQSSETNPSDIAVQQLPYIRDPYSDYKYWMYGTKGGSDQFTIRPPEEAQLFTMQVKGTHMFSSSTFLEVALQHNQMQYWLDYRDIARSAYYPSYGLPISELPDTTYGLPGYGIMPTGFAFAPRWGYPGDIWRSFADTRSYTLKADMTSQVTKQHLLKGGVLFSLQRFEKVSHEGGLGSGNVFAQVNDLVPIIDNPYEGAMYIQDKIEVGQMVVNAGLRLDFFDANKAVSTDIFDPLMISSLTPGNSGQIGLVGYDPDGGGPAYVNTPTQWALSPRLGISHPITQTTVLHFMYGKFNQRPGWNKLLSNPVVWTQPPAFDPSLVDSDYDLPESTLVTYRYFGQKVGNPALTWEKMIQYEVGFEQNLTDFLPGGFETSLDVTMYYKDAYDLTSLGIDQGPASAQIQESGANVDVRLYGDPYFADTRIPGQTIGNFTTTVNGAWADVRGVELKLNSRLPWLELDLAYTLSYLSTGSYHYNKMYKVFYDTATGLYYSNGVDTYLGASNTDGGGVGLDDAAWNPHNSAMIRVGLYAPPKFGPSLGGFHILADWQLNTTTRWAQGDVYTYYAPTYTGIQTPNNQTWESRWNTNLNLARAFPIMGDLSLRFFLQVTNLFNQRHLRMLSGEALRDYKENGILPYEATTGEPLEWSWYSNLPRAFTFGTTIEF